MDERKINVLDKGFLELVDYMGDDKTIADSARASFFYSEKKKSTDEQLIKYLIAYNHTSPFEQVEFRFLVKCPLFVARQWMRHRTWSYSELSRRYSSDNIEFYIPKNLDEKITKSIKNMFWLCEEMYDYLLTNKVKKEQARIVLPVSMYTTFYAKTDLHNLFHFLKLRRHKDSQYEIREYANAIEQLIEPVVPVAYNYWLEAIK